MTKETLCRREAKSRATQKAIVEAAEKLFINKGFAATAISEVAKEAGVTKSLIHHHFGSKEALWDAVESKHLQLVDDYLDELFSKYRDVQGARFYLQAMKDFFEFANQHQELLRMQAWICAEQRGKRTKPSLKVNQVLEDIERDRQDGIVRDDMNPKHIMIFLYCLVEQWFIGKDVYSHRLGINLSEDEQREKYIESMVKLFESGIFTIGHVN